MATSSMAPLKLNTLERDVVEWAPMTSVVPTTLGALGVSELCSWPLR